ncbi:MAG: efflux RND transporter periplasmic adaptor subunit [Vicinamibacterales bacterium]
MDWQRSARWWSWRPARRAGPQALLVQHEELAAEAVTTSRVRSRWNQYRQDQIRRSVDVVGTLAAADQVTIASQADGTVGRVLADLGDRVREGQVLIELDREKLQYAVDNQRAALARALAKYGASAPNQLPPVDHTPDVEKASAELAQARQSFERARELASRELLPKQSLDDAETLLKSKQAAYDSALQNAKNLSADIDANSALLRLAERQLRDASIRAPFDGYVQKRLVSIGDFVKAQAPVMTVVRMDTLKAVGEIPESMAPWVQVGQPVALAVDAFPGKTIAGSVSRISPAVNESTRAFAFEATVANDDHQLKPGTFARVHIPTTRIEPVLTIPYAAMQYRYGVYRVFTVNGDRLVLHELKTGDRVGDRMEIIGGIALDDRIAMTDVDNLADGMRVTVQASAPDGGGRGAARQAGPANTATAASSDDTSARTEPPASTDHGTSEESRRPASKDKE